MDLFKPSPHTSLQQRCHRRRVVEYDQFDQVLFVHQQPTVPASVEAMQVE